MTVRRAIIDITGEILPEAAGCLRDHGLSIVGSLPTPLTRDGVVRLIVEDPYGDKLPPACNEGWWRVDVTMTQRTYGKQRLVEVSDIQAVERVVFGPSFMLPAVA